MIRTLLIAPSCPWPGRVVATARALGVATVHATFAGAQAAPAGGADRVVPIARAAATDGAAAAAALVHVARHAGAEAVLTGPASAAEHAQVATACEEEGLWCVGARGAAAVRLAAQAPATWVRWGSRAEALVPPAARPLAAVLGAWLATAPRLRLALPVAADRAGRAAPLPLQEGLADVAGEVDLWEGPAERPPAEVRRAAGALATALCVALGEVGVAVLSAGLGEDGGLELVWSPFAWPLCQLGEQLAGVDLVEWQIRLAGGESLPCPPTGVAPLGAALQALVRAAAAAPLIVAAAEHLAVDTEVAAPGPGAGGTSARPVAALCAWGDDRAAARAHLGQALAGARWGGPGPTNLPALRAALGVV